MAHLDEANSSRLPRRIEWPIFILSSLRSGSTLLRYILDSHKNLACPPESKFIAGLELVIEYPQVIDALKSLGISTVDLARELRLLTERLMRRYTRLVNKPRWVDKTPSYYRHTRLIEWLFEKQVLYVILVRHPLDCICSLEGYCPQSSRSTDPDIARNTSIHGMGRYAWAQYWLDVYARLDVFAASLPDRSIVVRYEELVSSPAEVLQKILTFLGEPYDPDMIARAFSTTHTAGFGDLKIIDTTSIHHHSIGRWASWPRQEIDALWALVYPIATRFKYSNDGPFY